MYIGTVCLEKNRWGSKEPSFKVSEWADRFKADGLDGIELWENHYLRADEAEQKALGDGVLPITIFNSYVGFTDEEADARRMAAEAITTLQAPALKYNLGHDNDKTDEFRRNLLAWAEILPSNCRLICECHQGTVLDTIKAASEFYADLDPEKFQIMVHPSADLDKVKPWFDVCGDRIAQLHLQMRPDESDPTTPDGRKALEAALSVIKDYAYKGGLTIEFTRGIGRDENIDDIYANACTDLKICREILS